MWRERGVGGLRGGAEGCKAAGIGVGVEGDDGDDDDDGRSLGGGGVEGAEGGEASSSAGSMSNGANVALQLAQHSARSLATSQ